MLSRGVWLSRDWLAAPIIATPLEQVVASLWPRKEYSLGLRYSSSFHSGVPRLFRLLRPGLSASLRRPRRDLHQPSESRRHRGCTHYRAGCYQPFPPSIHLQIQTFKSARTEQLEIARLGENNFDHGLGLIHQKHGVANRARNDLAVREAPQLLAFQVITLLTNRRVPRLHW